MEAKKGDKELQKRIRSGTLTREDVARRLAELAFGKANDCVKLVLDDDAKLDGLDLSLLTELKRNDKGTLEVRLVDRLRALEQLAVLAQSSGTDLESFLQAMQGNGEPE
ncbi:MAG: XRE family transcriptional regulator [Ruminococcaceae bacterium]|nr:XRE family transcriptional regulator [Oscillospiraceae bacterium]